MIRHYTFYSETDGRFIDGHFGSTDPAAPLLNTPSGHKAIEGRHDHLSKRVDLTTGMVIDYQPPAPSIDHEWNAVTKRWQLSPAAQAKAATLVANQARIAALEAMSGPLVRKAVLGDVEAMMTLRALDEEITGLQVLNGVRCLRNE
jgi:hypothetical protein